MFILHFYLILAELPRSHFDNLHLIQKRHAELRNFWSSIAALAIISLFWELA
jgi:hypothetical protein